MLTVITPKNLQNDRLYGTHRLQQPTRKTPLQNQNASFAHDRVSQSVAAGVSRRVEIGLHLLDIVDLPKSMSVGPSIVT